VDVESGNTLVTGATLRVDGEWLKAIAGGRCASVFRRAACFRNSQKIRLQAKKIPDVGCGGSVGGTRAKGQSSAASPCAMRASNNVEEA
jgi:hypothetical protein